MMTGAKILVVDDDWAVLEIFRIKLSEYGYDVQTASSFEECREQIAESKPELLILDIWLGEEKGGTHLHDALICEGFDPKTPVIFMSSLVELGTPPKHAVRGGRFALYGKPFDFDQMAKEIQSLTGDGRKKTVRRKISAKAAFK